MRLLFVEDDVNLGRATAEGLREMFAVDWVTSAEEAEVALATTAYDLLVADVNLGGRSGLDLLRSLRAKKNSMPVLLLTARDALRHKVEGLNAGADDYLVKPFELEELLARCQAMGRRTAGAAVPVIKAGEVTFEPATGHTERAGVPVPLSGRERAVLECLMRNLGRAVSRRRIEESVYDWSNEDIESNTVEVRIAALRKKLGKDFIKTLRGTGYMICP